MPGPTATHPDQRRRRNKKKTAADLEKPAAPQGPTLPKTYVATMSASGPVHVEYSDTTRRWWNKIRKAPQATAYQDTHWEWLLALTPLFDRWIAFGDMDALKELRLQAPPFGLRPADANKLDWRIDPQVVGPPKDSREPKSERGRAAEFRVVDGTSS